jgi:hypothetical protein
MLLGYPNRADGCTLSSGSWEATLPLNNLKNRTLGKVARTTNDSLSSTKFDIDMTSAKLVNVLALVNHNLSLDAQFRIRGSTASDFSVNSYDSGWLEVWPSVYPVESLDWLDPRFWDGKYSEEEISGYTTALIHVLPSTKVLRYWRVEFDDTANAAGYVQVGRLFIGPTWEPEENAATGAASIGWETKTDIQEALGGSEFFQRRAPFRVSRFTLDILSESEAFSNVFEIQRQAGVDQEVLWIHNSDDDIHQLRRRFLGRLRQLSAIEYPYGNLNKTAFEVKELL